MAQGESQPEIVDLEECPLPGFSSITQFSNEGIKKILAATRAFQSLPSSGPAWDLQKSYPEFNRAMKNARKRLIPMITLLLNHANISTEEFRFGDIDEKFEFLVEANDDMLERIGCALDEASGLFQKAHTIVVNQGIASYSLRPPGLWGKRKAEVEQSDPTSSTVNADDDDKAMPVEVQQKMSNREIKKAVYKRTVKEKPQVRFKTPVDNSPSPFVPKLKEKPNSIKPLSILPEYNSKNEEFYGHPYSVELNLWEPSDSMLTTVSPQLPKALQDTPLVEVNTARDIEQLLRDLYPVTELAVDLEHHGYRSFLGFTCLMQISTRDKDYIIDTLALRDHLYHLNEIFTNPKIVKVC
ncbi:Exosome component 10 [Folsomia candida]|uniref:Exosome component 10 n=1 Tax=Folsomia candida TaxID=158441 RepID=A0A226ENQ0_FOLCA|nr:Exosome component 10 [Folsomia candida]